AEERPRVSHSLPLADRELEAAGEFVSEDGDVAARKLRDEVMRVGAVGCLDDSLEVVDPLVAADPDVVARRQLVRDEVLEDDRDRLPQLVRVDVRDVGSVPQDATGPRSVETGEE